MRGRPRISGTARAGLATVVTVTVTSAGEVPLNVTGLGETAQLVSGTLVVSAQLIVTKPENSCGERLSWYVAVWPATTVTFPLVFVMAEVDELTPVPVSGM